MNKTKLVYILAVILIGILALLGCNGPISVSMETPMPPEKQFEGTLWVSKAGRRLEFCKGGQYFDSGSLLSNSANGHYGLLDDNRVRTTLWIPSERLLNPLDRTQVVTYSYEFNNNSLILTNIDSDETYIYLYAGKFEGEFMRVYGIDLLEFACNGILYTKARADSIAYKTSYDINNNHIRINWSYGQQTYIYEFKDSTLTLTDIDTGEQFIYLRKSELIVPQPETPRSIGPVPVDMLSGKLVGPGGPLANQEITLNDVDCSFTISGTRVNRSCRESVAATTTTDSTGQYKFPNVDFGHYSLSFRFEITGLISISEVRRGIFVLNSITDPSPFSQGVTTIEAKSDQFDLFGSESEKIINFTYP